MPPDLRSRGIKRYSEAAHNVLKYVILGISKDIQKALNIYMYKWLKTAVLAICYDGVGNRLKGGAGRAEIFNALIGSDAYVVILPNFVFPFFVKGYM